MTRATASMASPVRRTRGRRPPAGRSGIGRLWRCRAGSAALEFALVAVPFLMLVFAILEFGRVVWTQSALQIAVERAARCAAVNAPACGTVAQLQAYAASQMLAPGALAADFSYAAEACGRRVSASKTVSFFLVGGGSPSLTLVARSCHPARSGS